MRLIRIRTQYPTGEPYVRPGAFMVAFVVMALAVTDATTDRAMWLAGVVLTFDAGVQYVHHWATRE